MEKKLKNKNVLAWRGIDPQTPGWEPAILSTRLQSFAYKTKHFISIYITLGQNLNQK